MDLYSAWKKWLTTAVVAVGALGLVSCGDAAGTLTKIQREKVVYIATIPFDPPFIYQDGQELVGSDARLAARIVDKLREELGSQDIRLHWMTRSHGTLAHAIYNRETDIGLGLFGISEERRQLVEFSKPYYTSELVLIINPVLKDLRPNQLDDVHIGVRAGTIMEHFVRENYPSATVSTFTTLDDAILALRRADVEAVIDDRNLAGYVIATAPAVQGLEIVPPPLGTVEIGVAVPPGETQLAELINQVIDEVSNGEYAEWLQDSLGNRLEEVEARHPARLERIREAEAPRRVVIRISRDEESPFNIYRMANLNFSMRNTSTGETYTTSRIDFQGRVGVSAVSVPPGSYALSLPRFNFNAGTFNISTTDPGQVGITIRMRADGSVAVSKN